jgi:uncharacterized repeat protein (TIGR03806 family)
MYLFGDNGSGRIWAWSPAGGGAPVYLANLPPGSALSGLCSFGVDGNGEIYMLKMGNPGRIYRLARATTSDPQPPALLSQTGVFSDTRTMTPSASMIPYDVNSPLWSDGAEKRRWLAVPNDGAPYSTSERIGFTSQGAWTFPNGTVFVKHFEIPVDETNPAVTRRLETRLIVRDADGGAYGLTYKWRPDNSDADLLPGSLDEDITIRTATGTRTQTWFYPSRQACLSCHTSGAHHVLGVNTRQLNGLMTYPSGVRDNQLRTLNQLGLFSPAISEAEIASHERLAAVTDTSAALEHRVRSYFDSNCSHCHQPGGTPAFWDARFQTPLSEQGIVNGPLATSLGGPNARVVAPGSVANSLAHFRMNTVENIRMPPLARNVIDISVVRTLEEWIATLQPPEPLPPSWIDADVGDVMHPGGSSYMGGSLTVRGSGEDIWGTEDTFHFFHRSLTGNGELIARIMNVKDTDDWAKAGVMIRASLAADARNAFMAISPQNGVMFQRRESTTTTAVHPDPVPIPPTWLRLVRNGSTLSGYFSADGNNWTLAGTATVALPDTALIGLAITGHDANVLGSATFESVQLMPAGTPRPPAPATPTNLQAQATSSSQMQLTWTDSSANEEGFAIERSTGGSFAVVATVPANTAAYTNAGLAAGTSYTFRVRATRFTGNSGYSNTATATTPVQSGPPPPSTWTGADIGSVAIAGSHDIGTSTATIRASGSDIWEGADAFRFVYRPLSGDGVMTAQVTGLTNTHGWAKAGVMLRASVAPGSANVFMLVSASNGVAVQNRTTAGAATTSTPGPWRAAPYWVRLARTGNTVTSSISPDGTTWTVVSTQTVTLPADALIGLAVTSHNNAALTTATFANISVTGGGSPPPPTPPPAAPSGLTATAVSASQINLTWADNSADEDGFQVERSTGGGTFALIATLPAGTTAYANAGLTASTAYSYRVRATRGTDRSEFTNTATATTHGETTWPTNLVATAISSTRIDLSWTDPSNLESGFVIDRATAGGSFTQLATTGPNVATYSDTSVTASTTYTYRVRAIYGLGPSGYSNEATATTPAPPQTGWSRADVGSVGMPGSDDMDANPATVRGSGSDIWDTADAFRFVYRSLAGDGSIVARVTGLADTHGWAKAGVMIRESTAPGARNTFIFLTPRNGLAVQNRAATGGITTSTAGPWGLAVPYWVRLVRTGNTIAASASADGTNWTAIASFTVSFGADALIGLAVTSHNNAALTTATFTNIVVTAAGSPPPPPPPTPPGSLTATATSSSSIALTWTDASTNETGFELERSADNVTFAPRTSLPAGTTQFTDTGLTAATRYYYRVRAVNGAGASAYSNVASADTTSTPPPPSPPAAPTGLTATAASSTQIALAWTDASTNESGFQIERSTDNVTFSLRTTTAAGATSASDTGLTASTTYYYRVRAINSAGNSAYSNTASARTADEPPPPPPPPPPAWQSRDIGAVGRPGSVAAIEGGIALTGSGEDIWNASDEFRYYYQALTGDGELIARVTSLTNTHGWAKAGVMFRESLEPGSAHALMCVSVEHGTAFQYRATTNGPSGTTTPTEVAGAIRWIRVVRSGNTLTGFESQDGTRWTQAGTRTFAFPATIFVGLAVTSHNDAATATANFTNITLLTGAPPPPPPITVSPPSNLVASAASSTQINLTWTDNATNETGFEVERSVGSGTFAPLAAIGADRTGYSDATVTAGTTYNYRVRAVAGTTTSAFSNTASATPVAEPPPPPPPTWSFGDIGAVGVAGSNSSSGNTITVRGSGSDIWGPADSFRFVYRAVTGDGVVEAQVTSMDNTNGWAKAGVMIRESLSAGSRNAFAFLTPVHHGMAAQARETTNGETRTAPGPARNAPFWVRLTRSGSTFTAASSPDGVTWTTYATFTVPMNATAFFGFAVTSHDNTRLNTAVFTDPFLR